MRFRHRGFLIALLIVSSLAISTSAQKTATPAASDVLLAVGGEVAASLKLTRAEEYQYEGVAIVDILQKAGLKFGEALRGKALATYVLVEAADGYQAVFALPEFDPPTKDRLILLADQQGAAFPATSGPLKIIAPGDKTHARWVRQVKSLTVVRAPKSAASE